MTIKKPITTAGSPTATTPTSPIKYSINLHDTLAQEKHISNGKENQYFVVVKNCPFLIVISSKGEQAANFKKNSVSACLLYDCEPRREVSLIRSSPLEYVTHISSNGEEITIEARIHVLTSQHEDSLFRVCVSFNNQDVSSEPLKVISKADNVRKPSKPSSPTNTSTPKKKRTATDAFGEALQRIELQQQEQRKLIDVLCQQNALLMSQLKQVSEATTHNTDSQCLSPYERPHKVRAMRKTINSENNNILMADFTHNFMSQQHTLLDDVLGFEAAFFADELLDSDVPFVPGSPQSLCSSTSSSPSPSPLSSPEHNSDAYDGYWSYSSVTHTGTNTPPSHTNDGTDFADITLTDNFISELLSADCTSIVNNIL